MNIGDIYFVYDTINALSQNLPLVFLVLWRRLLLILQTLEKLAEFKGWNIDTASRLWEHATSNHFRFKLGDDFFYFSFILNFLKLRFCPFHLYVTTFAIVTLRFLFGASFMIHCAPGIVFFPVVSIPASTTSSFSMRVTLFPLVFELSFSLNLRWRLSLNRP